MKDGTRRRDPFPVRREHREPAPGDALDAVADAVATDSEFRVQGSGFRVQGSGIRVQGSGFRAHGPGCRVQGGEALACRRSTYVAWRLPRSRGLIRSMARSGAWLRA